MKSIEFAKKVLSMPISKQNQFFENLKSELSKEDWETTVKFISLFSIFCDVAKYEAIKKSICDKLCEEFYGHTVDRQNNRDDGTLVSMYSNSIL